MATRKARVVVNGINSDVFRIYTTLGGVNRRIRRGYVTVSGVNRLFLSIDPIEYSSVVQDAVKNFDTNLRTASIGNYCLMGGGRAYINNAWVDSTYLYSFSSSLQFATATSLRDNRQYCAVGNNNSYAFFAGSYNNRNGTNTVDAYNSSLQRSSASTLSAAKYDSTGISSPNYFMVGGGFSASTGSDVWSNTVDAYNTSAQRTAVTALSNARSLMGGSFISPYYIFAGGYLGGTITSNLVEAYNTSFQKQTNRTLTRATRDLKMASNNSYAIFGGGTYYNGTTLTTSYTVGSYNSSLQYTAATNLPFDCVGQQRDMAISFNGYVVFMENYQTSSAEAGSGMRAYGTGITQLIIDNSLIGDMPTERTQIGAVGKWLFRHTYNGYSIIYEYTGG